MARSTAAVASRRRTPSREASGELQPERSGHFLGLSTSGFHETAYVEWGPADAEHVVVCVHGLTRQGRDFDHLAAHLSGRGVRVVCPDLIGRGRSSWLRDPKNYTIPQYCSDMNALIARTGAAKVDWVGTSLGGLIGLGLAGFTGHPIRRLVINDIGPTVPADGLLRIGRYVAAMPSGFASLEEAERYLRNVLAPFGSLSDEHWRHLALHSVHRDEAEDRYVTLCDPRIVQAYYSTERASAHLWTYWDAIDVPTLVVRGADSDLLPLYLAREMTRRNLYAVLHDVPGCGHAPTLTTPDQIATVAAFLLEDRPPRGEAQGGRDNVRQPEA
jgi:pimeloyl-ACP methyl ester carboxylesterase